MTAGRKSTPYGYFVLAKRPAWLNPQLAHKHAKRNRLVRKGLAREPTKAEARALAAQAAAEHVIQRIPQGISRDSSRERIEPYTAGRGRERIS